MDEPSTTTEQPTTSPSPGQSSGPRVTRDEVKDLGRLRRSVTDRHIAGVAGGLARHLDVDPIIVRVTLVVSIFFGGAGLLLYVAAWLLVPEEGTDDEPFGLDRRNRSVALAVVGVLAFLAAVGDWSGASWFPWPLVVLAALGGWYLYGRDKRSSRGTDPGATGGTTAYAPSAGPDIRLPDSDDTYARAGTAHLDDGARTWGPGWVGDGTGVDYARNRRPRNPRRRGPLLFLFTLALIALSEGVLGVVDLAGVDVVPSAYPALALGITATMLLVGSVWGRAGGLIALGLVCALATVAASVGPTIGDERLAYAPTTASDVQDSYEFGGGRLTLDLSGVTDVDALDGREISVDGVGGRVEVVVPDGMDVDVSTQLVGGQSRVFDQTSDGFDVTQDGFLDGGEGVPDMTISIDLVGGDIIVRDAA